MNRICVFLVLLLLFHKVLIAQESDTLKRVFDAPKYNFFNRTILVFNEYLDTDSGSYNTTDIRLLLPVGNKAWNLRLDAPIVSTNSSDNNKTGLGDLAASIAYIPVLNNHNGLCVRAKVVGNTATNSAFGSGKWIFVPTLFYGHFFDDNKKWLLISLLEYQVSFAGDTNRNDVTTTIFENTLYFNFSKNWLAADVAFRYNATIEGFQNNAYLELGRKLSKFNWVYIHPSVGFGKNRSYNAGIEVGILAFF